MRSGWRLLTRAPTYGITLVVTLALGIALVSAATSVGTGVLIRPLPHAEGDRLVNVRQTATRAGLDNALFSVPEIQDLRRDVAGFAAVAEYSSMRFTVLGMDQPRRVSAGVVTGNYFQVLGLEPVVGRVLHPADDRPGAAAVAVLTRGLWMRVFGGDTGVVGRTVTMDGRPVTLVGVVEDHPPFPERTELYVNMATSPHHLGAAMNHDRTHRMSEAFARLAPAARIDEARREVAAVLARGRADHPEAYDPGYGWGATVATLEDRLTRRARPVLALLGAVTGLVLLIVLANVVSLTLTRAVRSRGEMAVRTVLGATASDLRRRLLAENLVLGGAGALLGIALAGPGVSLLSGLLGRFTHRAHGLSLDGWGVGTALLLGAGTALLLTALSPVGGAESRTWRVRSRGETGGRAGDGRVQRALVVIQVAVSFVLLVGAGLLLRTILHLGSVDAGLDSRGVVVMELPPLLDGRDAQEMRDDQEAMVEAVVGLPWVTAAGLTNQAPLREGELLLPWTLDILVEEGPEPVDGAPLRSDFRTATPRLLETLGIQLLDGRGILPTDGPRDAPVALVNRAFARRYLDGRSPLGRRVAWTGDVPRFTGISQAWREIVGVVDDVRDHGLDEEPRPAVYVPFAQESFGEVLVLRGAGNVADLVPDAVTAIRSVRPEQPVENVATLQALRVESLGDRSLNAWLVAVLAGLAVGVAGVGLFGLLSYRVGTRRREMGVRMALGADRRRVVGMVLGEGLRLVSLGVMIGAVAAYGSSSALSGLLYGVRPGDPLTLASGAGLLMGLAVLAAAAPAYRAARVEPARVLGAE